MADWIVVRFFECRSKLLNRFTNEKCEELFPGTRAVCNSFWDFSGDIPGSTERREAKTSIRDLPSTRWEMEGRHFVKVVKVNQMVAKTEKTTYSKQRV